MNLSKKIDHHWILKLPVLFMYLLFFTVQIFFNLDTGSRTLSPYTAVYSVSHTALSAKNSKQDVAKSPAKSKIRLNKRYEPSSIPPLAVVVTERPVVYITSVKIRFYKNDFYHFVFLSSQSQRGPPFVA